MLTAASSASYISMYCKLLVIPEISRWGISTPSTCAVAPGAKLLGDQPNIRSFLLPTTPSRRWSPEPPAGSGGAPAQPPPPREQGGGFIRKRHPSAAGMRKGTLGRRTEHKRGAFLSCPQRLRETRQVLLSHGKLLATGHTVGGGRRAVGLPAACLKLMIGQILTHGIQLSWTHQAAGHPLHIPPLSS